MTPHDTSPAGDSTANGSTSPASASAHGAGAHEPCLLMVPLDGSGRAEYALPVAARICRALAGRIVLTRVITSPAPTIAALSADVPAEVYQRLEDDQVRVAEEYIASVGERLRAEGLPVEGRLGEGEPATTLLALAKDLPAALLIMTSHGRTGLSRLGLGSVADRVVRRGAVPVLLVRSFADSPTLPPLTLERGVVPLDGTPLAERVLDVVARLAGHVLREVTLLRAVAPDDEAGANEAQRYLAAVRDRLLGMLVGGSCVVKTEVRAGRAADAILARAIGPEDFILMATHGNAGLGRLVIGSVADRVLRGGRTSLLLVHPPHARAKGES